MQDSEQLFTNLLKEHKDKIFRICCYYIADAENRKDLYQEALLNIWRGLKSFRGEASYLTWMLRITVNTALKHISKERNRLKRDRQYFEEMLQDIDQNDESIDHINLLNKAINQLPLVDMIIISLFLEEVNSKEIANITGLKEGNIRVRIHRAKEQLRNIIEGGEL